MSRAIVCLPALLAAACGPPATLTEVEREVFVPSCVFSSCHKGQGASGLSLDGKTWARLVNVDAVDAPGRKLVVAKDLEASYLYEKISSSTPQTGTRMPQAAAPLDRESIELVKSWIENGARDD
jgi:hypothetical protein